MDISSMVNKLLELKEKHGNLPIAASVENQYGYMPYNVEMPEVLILMKKEFCVIQVKILNIAKLMEIE